MIHTSAPDPVVFEEFAKDFVRISALEGPAEALRRLTQRTLANPPLVMETLRFVEALSREIGQVAGSVRELLESQAGSYDVPASTISEEEKQPLIAVAVPFASEAAVVSFISAGDSEPPEPETAEELSQKTDVRQLLETLPHFSHLAENTARRLATAFPYAKITKTPRSGSRGNALLYVLSRYGRLRSLTIDDLSFAFETMNVPLGNAPSYRRVVSWEIRELMRRGWPIAEDKNGFRFNGTTLAPEGTMT